METNEQIAEKAKALSASLNTEVTPVVFTPKEGDQAVGYLKAPSKDHILYYYDKFMSGTTSDGAEAIFNSCLLKEESDPRFSSGQDADARILASGILAAGRLGQPLLNQFKKK